MAKRTTKSRNAPQPAAAQTPQPAPLPKVLSRKDQVRAQWSTFEQWLASERKNNQKHRAEILENMKSEMDRKLRTSPRNLHQQIREQHRREVEELGDHERNLTDSAREEWQARLKEAGLVDEDWGDMTPEEMAAVGAALGEGDEFEEQADPSVAVAALAMSFDQPGTFSQRQQQGIVNNGANVSANMNATSRNAVTTGPIRQFLAPSVFRDAPSRLSHFDPTTFPVNDISNYNTEDEGTTTTTVAMIERQSAYSKWATELQPRTPPTYIGPILYDPHHTLEEASFETFKRNTREVKIREFHTHALQADIALAHRLVEERSLSESERGKLVKEHNHTMSELQRLKEEERKSVVEKERMRRREDIRRREGRDGVGREDVVAANVLRNAQQQAQQHRARAPSIDHGAWPGVGAWHTTVPPSAPVASAAATAVVTLPAKAVKAAPEPVRDHEFWRPGVPTPVTPVIDKGPDKALPPPGMSSLEKAIWMSERERERAVPVTSLLASTTTLVQPEERENVPEKQERVREVNEEETVEKPKEASAQPKKKDLSTSRARKGKKSKPSVMIEEVFEEGSAPLPKGEDVLGPLLELVDGNEEGPVLVPAPAPVTAPSLPMPTVQAKKTKSNKVNAKNKNSPSIAPSNSNSAPSPTPSAAAPAPVKSVLKPPKPSDEEPRGFHKPSQQNQSQAQQQYQQPIHSHQAQLLTQAEAKHVRWTPPTSFESDSEEDDDEDDGAAFMLPLVRGATGDEGEFDPRERIAMGGMHMGNGDALRQKRAMLQMPAADAGRYGQYTGHYGQYGWMRARDEIPMVMDPEDDDDDESPMGLGMGSDLDFYHASLMQALRT